MHAPHADTPARVQEVHNELSQVVSETCAMLGVDHSGGCSLVVSGVKFGVCCLKNAGQRIQYSGPGWLKFQTHSTTFWKSILAVAIRKSKYPNVLSAAGTPQRTSGTHSLAGRQKTKRNGREISQVVVVCSLGNMLHDYSTEPYM